MNDPSQMMNRSFGMWPPQADDLMGFPNPSRPPPLFAGAKPPGRVNWKGMKAADKRKKAAAAAVAATGGGGVGVGGGGSYKPPALKDLQFQNRLKARRFYPKKKFTRFAPFAPRNTTSFIIRAKNSGGIASLVSPCPVTPAILPTPKFSPSREDLIDMAKEEWGVDGYGTMKGLIRLRPPPIGYEIQQGGPGEEDEEDEEESSDSDAEEHLEVERRLDHDVSRFEMVYPGEEHGPAACLLENRVDDQDTHIAQLEEENLTLKERLFFMEQEMRDLRRRLLLLEEKNDRDGSNNNVNKNNNNDNNNNNNNNNNIENAGEEGSENEGSGDGSSEKGVGECDDAAGTPMHE